MVLGEWKSSIHYILDERGRWSNLEFYNVVMCYHGDWKLLMHKGGCLSPISGLLRCLICQRLLEESELPRSSLPPALQAIELMPCGSFQTAWLAWQGSSFTWGTLFLFHTLHEVRSTGMLVTIQVMGFSLGFFPAQWVRYCVHLFLFLLHFNERIILVQNAALEVSWLHLSPITYWLCFFIIFYSTEFETF